MFQCCFLRLTIRSFNIWRQATFIGGQGKEKIPQIKMDEMFKTGELTKIYQYSFLQNCEYLVTLDNGFFFFINNI